MAKRYFLPFTPARSSKKSFSTPVQISQYRLADSIGVTPLRINEIVHGRRAITADTALRLGRYFGVEAEF